MSCRIQATVNVGRNCNGEGSKLMITMESAQFECWLLVFNNFAFPVTDCCEQTHNKIEEKRRY